MKKYLIGIVVLILIIIGIFSIWKNKNLKKQDKNYYQSQNSTYTTSNDQTPSALSNETSYPDISTTSQIDYRALAEEELKKQQNQPNILQQPSQQSIPPAYMQITGGCNKTIDDIINDYGKVWGIVKPQKNEKGELEFYGFTKEENENFMKIFLKYAWCEGIINRNINKCYSLIKNIEFNKNQKACDKEFDDLMFLVYASNKRNSRYEFCSKFFSRINSPSTPKELKEAFSNANEKDFCNIAKNGIENMCDNFLNSGLIKNKDLALCYKIFPRKVDDCGVENEFCLRSIAVSKNNISLCNDEECHILIKDSCEDIKNQVILTYCNFYNRVEMQRKEEKEHKKLMEMIKGGRNVKSKE